MSATPQESFKLAFSLYQRGHRREAAAAFEAILRKNPRYAPAIHMRGFLMLEAGDAAGAELVIREALALDPLDPSAQQSFGLALRMQGRALEAVHPLLESIRLAPGNAQAMNALGLCQLELGDLEGALETLRRATATGPGLFEAHNNLGLALSQLGRLEEAESAYRAALALRPTLLTALGGLGIALLKRGKAAEAVAPLRAVVQGKPDDAETRSNLALALEATGDSADAERMLREAMAIDPGLPSVPINLGSLLARQGRLAESLALFDKGMALAPDNPNAQHNRANLLVRAGRAGDAEAGFTKAIALRPDYADAHFGLSLLLLSSGKFERAWREYMWRPLVIPPWARGVNVTRAEEPDLPERLESRRAIVLIEEQGLGDVLFFLRWWPLLRARGWAARLRCTPRLWTLLARVEGLELDRDLDQPLAEGDIALLLPDLPRLAQRLGEEAIPPSLSVAASPEAVEKARQALAKAGEPPYVALTWRAGVARSVQGREMLPRVIDAARLLQALPAGGTVVSVQRALRAGEMEALHAVRPVADFSTWNEDLDAMLGLLAAVGRYTAVDNTNIHLMALLGRGANVLIPHPPEWHWAAGATGASLWFPRCLMLREDESGWDGALAALARA